MAEDTKIPVFGGEARRELYQQRVLVLDGPLDDDNGTLLATQLLALGRRGSRLTDIALWIHSPGGSVPSMLAIRDVMRLVPYDVSTLALGLACSAGQFLLSAGTKGKRFALPHARILMHQGSAGIGGTRSTSRSRPTTCGTCVDTVLGPHRGGHRPAGGADLRRLAARPLVHRRARPASTASSTAIVDSFAAGRARRRGSTASGCRGKLRHELVHDPERHRRSTRAASASWTSTRTCSPSGSSTSAPRSTPGVANALIAQLLHLEADSQDRDIQLYINCEGGDPSAMLAVYDTMQHRAPDVATTCVGPGRRRRRGLLAAGARASAPCCRTPGSCCTSRPGRGAGRSPT